MVTFRPMSEADVPAAVAAFDSGLLAMLARHQLPVTGSSIQDERRRQDRTRHFLGTDPAGSWVAEDAGTVIGMSQSFVREDYWMLSQLGTVPGRQGHGVGRELLRLALSHGDPRSPGTIQCFARPQGDGAVRQLRFRPPPGGGGLGRHAPRIRGAPGGGPPSGAGRGRRRGSSTR